MPPAEPNPFESPRTPPGPESPAGGGRRRALVVVLAVVLTPLAAFVGGACCCSSVALIGMAVAPNSGIWQPLMIVGFLGGALLAGGLVLRKVRSLNRTGAP